MSSLVKIFGILLFATVALGATLDERSEQIKEKDVVTNLDEQEQNQKTGQIEQNDEKSQDAVVQSGEIELNNKDELVLSDGPVLDQGLVQRDQYEINGEDGLELTKKNAPSTDDELAQDGQNVGSKQ